MSAEVHRRLGASLKGIQERHIAYFQRAGPQIVPGGRLLGVRKYVQGEAFGAKAETQMKARLIQTAVETAFRENDLLKPSIHVRDGIGGGHEVIVVPKKIDLAVLMQAIRQ